MGEIKLLSNVYVTEYKCTKCKKSYIVSTGKTTSTAPSPNFLILHEHECPSCGAKFNLEETYPYVSYDYDSGIKEKKNGKKNT